MGVRRQHEPAGDRVDPFDPGWSPVSGDAAPTPDATMDGSDEPSERRPSIPLRDWALLAVNMLFVLAGAAMLPSDPHGAVVTLALFGSGAAFSLVMIVGKRRQTPVGGAVVEVAGGVPIRARRAVAVLAGVWLFLLGAVMAWFGDAYPLFFRLLSVSIAAFGLSVLVAVAFFGHPRGFLRFEDDGFYYGGGRWCVRIPWEAIAGIEESELNGNPFLLLWVTDPAGLEVDPPAATPALARHLQSNATWVGAHFAIHSGKYGIPVAVLAAAIRRYAADPLARAALRRRRLPGPGG